VDQLDGVGEADLPARRQPGQVVAREQAEPALRLGQRIELPDAKRVDLAQEDDPRHAAEAPADHGAARARHVMDQPEDGLGSGPAGRSGEDAVVLGQSEGRGSAGHRLVASVAVQSRGMWRRRVNEFLIGPDFRPSPIRKAGDLGLNTGNFCRAGPGRPATFAQPRRRLFCLAH
jgi:hypothetical protein